MQSQSLAFAHTLRTPAPSASDSDPIKLIGAARTYARDQAVFGEGDGAGYVYKVVSGAVRTFRILADGRRQVEEFYLPGDVFGFELGDERRTAAEALSDAVLIVARRATVTSDADNAGRVLTYALRELGRRQTHVVTLGRRSAIEKVASFLLDLAERLDADRELELPMSRQDIADYLGLTIETVSRTLTQLQADGLIALSGCRRVRLSRPAALAELCE